MNLFNQILILVILLIGLNYITNGTILETLKNFINNCKNNMEPFMGLTYTNKRGVYSNTPDIPNFGQLDYPYHNYKYNPDMNNIYFFLTNLVTPNVNIYELTTSNSNRIPADYSFEKQILVFLNTILNNDSDIKQGSGSNNYLFKNIKLLDKIYYYINPRGKEIESFRFVSDVFLKNNRPINKIYFYIELFLKNDISFNNEVFVILNIRIIDNNSQTMSKQKMKKINNNMNKTVNDIFIINDNKIVNGYDTDNSLIPSNINISDNATESS